jgi:hypothetical protein
MRPRNSLGLPSILMKSRRRPRQYADARRMSPSKRAQELPVVALPSSRWSERPEAAGHGVDETEIDDAVHVHLSFTLPGAAPVRRYRARETPPCREERTRPANRFPFLPSGISMAGAIAPARIPIPHSRVTSVRAASCPCPDGCCLDGRSLSAKTRTCSTPGGGMKGFQQMRITRRPGREPVASMTAKAVSIPSVTARRRPMPAPVE